MRSWQADRLRHNILAIWSNRVSIRDLPKNSQAVYGDSSTKTEASMYAVKAPRGGRTTPYLHGICRLTRCEYSVCRGLLPGGHRPDPRRWGTHSAGPLHERSFLQRADIDGGIRHVARS